MVEEMKGAHCPWSTLFRAVVKLGRVVGTGLSDSNVGIEGSQNQKNRLVILPY